MERIGAFTGSDVLGTEYKGNEKKALGVLWTVICSNRNANIKLNARCRTVIYAFPFESGLRRKEHV